MTQPIVLRSTRRRRWPRVFVVLLLLLCASWSALWVLAQRQLSSGMDLWFASEAAEGRPWSCPDRDVSGYPFALTLSCTRPTFTARIGGEVLEGEVAGLRAEAGLAQPNTVRVTVASPMTMRNGPDPDVATLSWSGLSIDLGVSLAARPRAALVVDGLAIARPDQPETHVDHADVELADVGGSGAVGRSYRMIAQIAGALIPELDDATGTPAPLGLAGTAVITALEIRGVEPWQDIAERWRLAGGRIEVASLTYEKGPLRVAASGQLRLDDLHRVGGVMQTTLAGYESLAARLGLPLRAVSFGGALAGLLNGSSKASPSPAVSGSIAMPVAFSDGRIAIGPFKTSLRLAPVY